MIAIVNIDPNPRESGEHLYELRDDSKRLTTFTHNKEDSLHILLTKAANAYNMCMLWEDTRCIQELFNQIYGLGKSKKS